jgi:hypothetical protein
MRKTEQKNTVTLCSYKDNNWLLWTPKAVIKMKINEKWEEYPVQWDEETFFLRHKANEYALKKSKEWLSRNSQIKEKRIFTESEWFEHKVSMFFAWIITVLFVAVVITTILFSI